jgi:uncharacterized protein
MRRTRRNSAYGIVPRYAARAVLLALAIVAATVSASAQSARRAPDERWMDRSAFDANDRVSRVVARARDEVQRRVSYDGTYRTLTFRDGKDTGRFTYPAGDVAPDHGVCTDVVVRAFREGGVDLQVGVHEDVLARPAVYAPYVRHPDANIDHRRVGPLMTFFARHTEQLPRATSTDADRLSFRAGDVVVWTFAGTTSGYPNHVAFPL